MQFNIRYDIGEEIGQIYRERFFKVKKSMDRVKITVYL